MSQPIPYSAAGSVCRRFGDVQDSERPTEPDWVRDDPTTTESIPQVPSGPIPASDRSPEVESL